MCGYGVQVIAENITAAVGRKMEERLCNDVASKLANDERRARHSERGMAYNLVQVERPSHASQALVQLLFVLGLQRCGGGAMICFLAKFA